MYYCCGITDPGEVREHNEDAYLINKIVMSQAQMESQLHTPFIVGVADGVGGENSGEVASRLALELVSGMKISPNTDYEKKLLDIHRYIRRYGIVKHRINMQTTLCALAADSEGNATIINIGDSKLFRYRGGNIKQLSTDQSLVQVLYENGHITAEEKKHHVHRNVIFPVLGNVDDDPKVEVTKIEGGICPGDLILICTDGLADYITRGEFEETLAQPVKLPKRLAALIELAKKGGSTDNITVLGISIM
ncbi:MAG: serine/threonine-protein phosphatase [Oscillospiraceae bacterium]|nr:serine/threonine-protein phosphatase [Oscillospiraceae bacterium]